MPGSRGKDFQTKKEDDTKDSKFARAASSSRQWAGFKNPRIVRVSRSFGGKDRHSKVCTVRGLRDRRIRLSVPTAVQLYDLQDKLGLNQPSKVVDWLLDATKNDIDDLPPLQMPPGCFNQFQQPTLAVPQVSNAYHQSAFSSYFQANPVLSRKEGIKISDNVDGMNQTMAGKFPDAGLGPKNKEVERETIMGKTKWNISTNDQENQAGIGGYSAHLSAQNFFAAANQSSIPGLLNSVMPYNFYSNWDPSNLSLSQFGSQELQSQTDQDPHKTTQYSLPNPPSSANPYGSQFYFCPSGAAPPPPPLFPPYLTPSAGDPRQINHFQLLGSNPPHNVLPNSLMPSLLLSNPQMKCFPFNVNSKFLHPQNNHNSQLDKGNSGS